MANLLERHINPSRAETDKHWRGNLNREQTRQVYIDSAKAGNHAPGKGPSCSDNISLSQMTSEQQLARTLAISEVDTGKGRAKAPDTSDSDLDTSGNNTGNTADKATPQNNQVNKSTKTAKTKTQHKHKAFFVPPAKYVNGQHDDVIKWKNFPRYWPFVREIHRSRWIPHTKASDAELWCLLWSAPE